MAYPENRHTAGLWVALDDIVNPKRNNFGLVRLLAALCVLLSHIPLLLTGLYERQLLSEMSVYSLGDHAVNVFFVVSGILISASLARTQSLVEFAVARTLRIFPALFACALVAALFLGPLTTTLSLGEYGSDPGVLRFILVTASAISGSATLPGVFVDNPPLPIVIGPVWTLKYELTCYFLLALLSLTSCLATTRRFVALIVGSWIVSGSILVSHGEEIGTPLDNMLRLWFAFSIGMGFYRFHRRIPLSLGVAAAALAAWWITLGTPLELVVSLFAAGYLALWFAMLPMGRLRTLTNKVDLSYGIYVFGWPIGQMLVWVWPHISLSSHMILSLLVTVPLAALSWFLVEKPAMVLRRRVFSRGGFRAETVEANPARL